MALTIDLRINNLGSSEGDDLIAHASLLKAGRTVTRADVDVYDKRGRPPCSWARNLQHAMTALLKGALWRIVAVHLLLQPQSFASLNFICS